MEPIAGSVTSVVDALMHVVLSEAEKHVPYGELVGITDCMTLYPRCRANRGSYNRVQLYADNKQPCEVWFNVLFPNDRRAIKSMRLRQEVLIQCVWDVTDFTEAQRDNTRNAKLSVIEKCEHVNWARLRTLRTVLSELKKQGYSYLD